MIIDLKAIRQKGLCEKDFSFEFVLNDDLLTIPEAKFSKPCKAEVLCEVYADKAYVSGKVFYGISAPCARCLAPASFDGEVEFDEEFRPVSYGGEKELSYAKDIIDLKPLLEQLIITNLPYSVFCKENCKGICPVCGKNLNDGDCGCSR